MYDTSRTVRSHRRGDRWRERGSATWMIVAAVALAGVMAVGIGRLGTQAILRTRASAAADAAALAAAQGGVGAARSVAAANGTSVGVSTRQSAGRVDAQATASVAVGDASASATAAATRHLPVGGVGTRAGLAPVMLAALARADELLGEPVPVVSGHRSAAHQERLWAARHLNPYPVARPGTSRHELGLAVDVPIGFVGQLLEVAAASGLCHPLPTSDPVHFIVCPNPR